MSPVPECDGEMSSKERRTRKTHAKVKTGCVTCKIRRKKCDETKPFCLRCTNTGRKCDGYNQPTVDSSPRSLTTSSPPVYSFEVRCPSEYLKKTGTARCSVRNLAEQRKTSICRPPSTLSLSHDIDYQCFDFFRFNTGPQMQSYFDSSIWRDLTLKAALSNPAVLKIMSAVGAVHQRLNHGISREAFELCAVADRLHREAADALLKYRREEELDPNFKQISMIALTLLGLYEVFQGNYEKSVDFTTLALRSLWKNNFAVVHSESKYYNHDMKPSLFFNLFYKLRNRAIDLFGSAPTYKAVKPGESLPPLPSCFASLNEASDSIFAEIEWILHAPAGVWTDEATRQQTQNLHVSRITEWSAAYAELLRSHPDRTTTQKQASQFLRLVRDAAYLLLYLVFFARVDPFNLPHSIDLLSSTTPIPTDESPENLLSASHILWSLISNQANLSTNLTRVCMLAESVLDNTSAFAYTSHSFAADTCIGMPRLQYPSPEGSAKTRHLVRSLLKRKPHDDSLTMRGPDACTEVTANADMGVSKVPGVYSIAELSTSLDEYAVLAAAKDLVPKHLNPQWVDITCFLDERRLLLRYCRPDGPGELVRGLVWVQEWIEF